MSVNRLLMGDYRVMHWHGHMDGPWTVDASRKFREGGYDGLALLPSREWTPQNLDFLLELPGLRLLRFTGRLKDDRAAFRIASLEDLTLVTGSKLPIPDVTQTHLSALCLVDRPGLTIGSRWPNLARLQVGQWKGTDLRFLNGASSLTQVHLEGSRQSGSLSGIETSTSLESLELTRYSITDTRPLSALDALTEVKLLAAKPTPPHADINLVAFTSPRLTKLWIINAAKLRNFSSLQRLSSLREVRLIDCRLSEADLGAISSLPDRLKVEVMQ